MVRLLKAYGILANILALIDDIPLGHRRIERGLELTQSWFINGTLYNSEIWQKLTEKDKSDLNKKDHILLRSIVGAQAKVPIEQLYLETASLTPTQVIYVRRMIYLQTILKRPANELIRKIYEEMKNDPIPVDWSELVRNVFEELNMHIDNKLIQEMDIAKYKALIKKEVRESAFIEFKLKQSGHEKGNKTPHENPEKPQKYLLTNKLTNKQISLLFN